MEEIARQLRELASAIEKRHAQALAEEYQKQPHRNFAVGDYVTDGADIGKVGWIENRSMEIAKEDGYFGLDRLNGSLGFKAPCKRDRFRLLTATEKTQFTQQTERRISLSGEEIEIILHYLDGDHSSYHLTEKFKALRFVLFPA